MSDGVLDSEGNCTRWSHDHSEPDAIPNRVQPDVCPHGCRTPAQCLRYDQGGSIPADCLLEQRPADATRNRAAVDVIAQMIRAYEGKGIAAGTFAEAIEDALAKAGYKVVDRVTPQSRPVA